MAFTRDFATVQSNIFWHCTWVRLFLVLCAAQRAAAGCGALGEGCLLYHVASGESQRALAALCDRFDTLPHAMITSPALVGATWLFRSLANLVLFSLNVSLRAILLPLLS